MSATDAPIKRRPVDTSGRGHARKFRNPVLRWLTTAGLSYLALLAFFVSWQVYVWVAQPDPLLLPGPIDAARELVFLWTNDMIQQPFLESMSALALGVSIAIVLGTLVGVVIGSIRLLEVTTMPYLWAFFAMPRSALVPLFLLWFGLGFRLTVNVVFISAFIPMVLQVVEGMRTVDNSLVRAATVFGGTRRQTMRTVVLPSAIPFMANGLRQSVSRGFIGLIVTEMLVSSGGLGTQAIRAMSNFETARLMAIIGVLVGLSVVLINLSQRAEAAFSRWREDVAI